ncbi:MAG: prepilin-type N-terminal cleavage/methylation domain-containing protein, partial [Azonexus sp.]
MKKKFLRRASAGFTLIELLVSIAIGLFLVTVVGGVYLSSKDSFN